MWSRLHELLNPFDNDDPLQRSLILWLMAVLVAYGNSAPLDDEDIGAYMTARMTCNSAHRLCSFASYDHRPSSPSVRSLHSMRLQLHPALVRLSLDMR